jgi:hypothetical protein
MKKKITGLQANAFVSDFEALKDSGVSFKGLAAVDLAMNLTRIEPEVIAFRKLGEPSAKFMKYREELQQISLEESAPMDGKIKPGQGAPFADGPRAARRIAALRAKYAAEIKSMETREEAQRAWLDKVIDVDIIEIPRDQIDIAEKSDRAAGVLAGLSIVIKA